MLKEVFSMIAGGQHTVDSISLELNVDERRVTDVIQQLSIMGYIIDVTKVQDCSSSACRACPMRKGCHGERDKPPLLKMYGLTEKGRRVLG